MAIPWLDLQYGGGCGGFDGFQHFTKEAPRTIPPRSYPQSATTHQSQMKLAVKFEVRLFRHLVGAFRVQPRKTPILIADFLFTQP